MSDSIAILDAWSQYGKLVDKKVRWLWYNTKIYDITTSAEQLENDGIRVVIITGSGSSVNDTNSLTIDPNILSENFSVLGICYGLQLINKLAWGEVISGGDREEWQEDILISPESPLFLNLEWTQKVLLTHGDSVMPENIAHGYESIATSKAGIVAAIQNTSKKIFWVQFHPEVDLTENGEIIFENFLQHVAWLSKNFKIEDREEQAIKLIREKVGKKKVLSLVSGWVDSSVCTALLAKALPSEQIIALHIDNGFMRHKESERVMKDLQALWVDLHIIDASNDFYNATTIIKEKKTPILSEVTDPEMKRLIIWDTFIKVQQREVEKLWLDPNEVMLAMGTLRPDLIESASKLASSNATKIKTHHNDTDLVRSLRDKWQVVEPLTELHKDEARALGESLWLSHELVWRQPFPGPGLAIRIICANDPYITEEFDRIQNQLRNFETENIKTTLIPIRTVGVQGDGRSFSYLVGLSGEGTWEEREKIAKSIPKSIRQVNRIVHIFGDTVSDEVRDITPTHLTPDVIKQLQLADNIVNEILLKYNLTRTLSQVPVILFPVGFGEDGKRSIAIRTFITNDFMTGVPAIPWKTKDASGKVIMTDSILDEIVQRILSEVPWIGRVVYDLTGKPPGTTEWE